MYRCRLLISCLHPCLHRTHASRVLLASETPVMCVIISVRYAESHSLATSPAACVHERVRQSPFTSARKEHSPCMGLLLLRRLLRCLVISIPAFWRWTWASSNP